MSDRSKTIGSSEISAIMGLNKYMTGIDVYKRKMGLEPEFAGNAATERGLLLEPVVATWFAKQTGIEVHPDQQVFMCIDFPCSATPDYYYWLPTEPGESKSKGEAYAEAKGLLEIKTTKFWVDKDDIPQSWFLQAQYQAAVLNYLGHCVEEISLAWLDGNLQFDYMTFDVDKEFGLQLLNFAKEWWDNHVGKSDMPDPVTNKEASEKWSQHIAGQNINASDALNVQIQGAKRIKDLIKQNEEILDGYLLRIKSIMQDAEAVTDGDQVLCTWKKSKDRIKFNEKAFKESHPDLYQEFCESTPGSRMFLFK